MHEQSTCLTSQLMVADPRQMTSDDHDRIVGAFNELMGSIESDDGVGVSRQND